MRDPRFLRQDMELNQMNPTGSQTPDSSIGWAPVPAGHAPTRSSPARPGKVRAQMREFFIVDRRWLVFMSLFVLLSSLELYFVQAHTLVDPNGTGPRFMFWAPKFR